MSKKEKYWHCIIGPAATIPIGADAPLRNATQQAFRNTVKHHAKHIYSGWGVSKNMAKVLLDVSCMDENSKEFKALLKKVEETEQVFGKELE